mgnify:FL=1
MVTLGLSVEVLYADESNIRNVAKLSVIYAGKEYRIGLTSDSDPKETIYIQSNSKGNLYLEFSCLQNTPFVIESEKTCPNGYLCFDGACISPGSVCGNGYLEEGEQCDDGNQIDGDGCSKLCGAESSQICSDSDGGAKYDIKGEATKGNQREEDKCIFDRTKNEYVLSEMYCEDNEIQSVLTFFGNDVECKEGVCVNLIESLGCTDSDSENGLQNEEFNIGGTVSSKGINYKDYCGEGKDIIEYYCDENNNLGYITQFCGDDSICKTTQQGLAFCLKTTKCGNGKVETLEKCDDGNTNSGDGCSVDCKTETGYQCIGLPSKCFNNCTDTDGGVNYEEKGTANSLTDVCYNDLFNRTTDKKLMEYYCNFDRNPNGESRRTIYDCPDGCLDGKCVVVHPSPPSSFLDRLAKVFGLS